MSDFYYRPVRDHDDEEEKPIKEDKKSGTTQISDKIKAVKKHIDRWANNVIGLKSFKKPVGQKRSPKEILIMCGIGFVGLIGFGIIALAILIAVVSIGLPDVHDLDRLAVAQSTTIYDREGNILYTKHGGENREYVSFSRISENLVNATVAMEDDRFWEHTGFDPTSILRAVFGQLTGNSRGGGSTITQQYVKNAFLSPERTYTRKLKELILAVQLEQEFDKEKILELYLNKIPYGNNAYGVQKAAEIYFDKEAIDLTVPESAILAALPQAPSYYNPYGEHRYSQLAKQFDEQDLWGRNIRTEADLRDDEFMRGLIGNTVHIGDNDVYIQGRSDLVLKAMNSAGYITESEMEDDLAKIQNIEFNEYKEKITAPHFVFYILAQLEEEYGKELVEQGGLKVYTSLDPKLQEYAETAVEKYADSNAEGYNVKNEALISLDPKTGEILAMVGSRDYFSEDIDGAVNITTQYRQPGSSFKPIVYAEAFNQRYAPSSIVFDVKTQFSSDYAPNNYDGTFMGPISIRKALGQSRNIPAIKAFYLAGGQQPIIDRAQNMGIHFQDTEKEYGAPLALGTAEAMPLDMASAFGTFANGGIHHDPVAILKVENSAGETLEEWKTDSKEAEGKEGLDPQIAYLITDILSDKSVGLGEGLNVPGKITAAKTGTSNSKDSSGQLRPRDLWTIGYSPNLVTAVWAGNNSESKDGRLSYGASGLTNAAPIWKNYMINALSELPSESFDRPEGITEIEISKRSGLLPGPNTPDYDIGSAIFASFAIPTEVDNSGQEVEIDTRNNKLANEYCPEESVATKTYIQLKDVGDYESWQAGAEQWMRENVEKLQAEGSTSNTIFGPPPTETSELCTQARAKDRPKVQIKSPQDDDHLLSGEHIPITVKIDAKNIIKKAEYYLDGQLNTYAEEAPWEGTLRLPKGETEMTEHEVSVKVFDNFGYTGEDTITIRTSPSGKSTTSSTTAVETVPTEPSDLPPKTETLPTI